MSRKSERYIKNKLTRIVILLDKYKRLRPLSFIDSYKLKEEGIKASIRHKITQVERKIRLSEQGCPHHPSLKESLQSIKNELNSSHFTVVII